MNTRRIALITTLWFALILVLALPPWVGTAGADATLDDQLIKAAARADAPLVKSLVDKGADVNARRIGGTVLMAAARAGNADLVEYLIDKGADVNAKDIRGDTALTYLNRYMDADSTEMVRYLRSHGAK
jgi:ankyrin repeat protein